MTFQGRSIIGEAVVSPLRCVTQSRDWVTTIARGLWSNCTLEALPRCTGWGSNEPHPSAAGSRKEISDACTLFFSCLAACPGDLRHGWHHRERCGCRCPGCSDPPRSEVCQKQAGTGSRGGGRPGSIHPLGRESLRRAGFAPKRIPCRGGDCIGGWNPLLPHSLIFEGAGLITGPSPRLSALMSAGASSCPDEDGQNEV